MDNFDAGIKWERACCKFDEQAEKIMKGYYAKLHDLIEHEECNLSRNCINIFFEDGRSLELFLDLDGLKCRESDSDDSYEIQTEYTLPTLNEIIETFNLKRKNNLASCC